MEITPDTIVIAQWGPIKLNATILFAWLVTALMVVGAWLVTRDLSTGTRLSRGQNLLEVVVDSIRDEIRGVSQQEDVDKFLPFVGTLFLFIAVANSLTIIPGYRAPTSSLSTTVALALCVLVAVPVYGVWEQGLAGYLKNYLQPSAFMLPFNIISELSRTLTLAMRLFGNIMSGSMIVAILVSIVPLLFPMIMQAFGLLIGLIQAYVFAILAMVYIASGLEVAEESTRKVNDSESSQSEKGAQ